MRFLFAGAVCALIFAAGVVSKAQEASAENGAANADQAVDAAANDASQNVVQGEHEDDVALGANTAAGDGDVVEGDRELDGANANQDQLSQANQPSDGENDRNARWRFVRHNGEWWYYTPDRQWLYYRSGQWHVFDANVPQQQAMSGGERRYSFQGEVEAADYATDVNAQGVMGYPNAAQPMYQSNNPTDSFQYSGRRYSYSGDVSSTAEVSRIPSGSRTGSRYDESTGLGPLAPRMINNNPRSATWGRVR